MKNTGTLKLTAPSEREIVMTRVFDAPRRLVFEAFTKPELLKTLAARSSGMGHGRL
jgi:uncharacterized protein YndB with AHSA1/START domain